ncbi:3850_t:CDS:2, partial [Funneliformis mosseae]
NFIEFTKEYDQELPLRKTSISQVKPLFTNVYELESIDNTNNITTRSVSSTNEQNTASMAHTAPRSVSSMNEQNMASMAHTVPRLVSFTDKQNMASTTSIDCIDFNNLALIFTAFVQVIKSGTLLPNMGYTSYMHPQSIMTSDNMTTLAIINNNASTNQIYNNTSLNNVSVSNIKTRLASLFINESKVLFLHIRKPTLELILVLARECARHLRIADINTSDAKKKEYIVEVTLNMICFFVRKNVDHVIYNNVTKIQRVGWRNAMLVDLHALDRITVDIHIVSESGMILAQDIDI